MSDSRSHAAIKKQVLSLLRNHGNTAFRPKEISKTLGLTDNNRYKVFREVLDELSRTNQVESVQGGRFQYRKTRQKHVVEGLLSVNPRGFGFVSSEDLEEDVYIPKSGLKTALDGDRVRIELAASDRGRQGKSQREGQVLEVLERVRVQTVGTFDRKGHFAFVVPDDQKLTHDIYVPSDAFNGATEGDKVVVSIDAFDDPKASPEGRVLRVLGRADDPGVSVLALAMAQGIRSDFPAEVEAEADRLAVAIFDSEIARRLDLRVERIFTIDPIDAKDFDDAIHINRLDTGDFEVGVHIADVSHYVKAGTELDEEAFARGTSTYLVDRVIPMLPEVLSNGICSLRPNEDKLTYSCLMTVTRKGEVKGYRIEETVIHSRSRLTYEDAQAIIDGGGQDHPMRDDVLLAANLARTLTRKRMKEGSIDFDVPEARVVLDDMGRPIDIILRERKESNRLIEEFMLLANKSVAMEVGLRLRKPFVYRIHAAPDSEKIRNLAQYVAAFGYKLPLKGDAVTGDALNDLLRHVKGSAEQPVIETAAIQAMAKAIYSPANIGHFGLGFSHYTHFTSPIRRYPDLIVHRLLKRYLADGKSAKEDELATQCKHCSDRERVAVEAERESVQLKKVEYAAQHLGDEFDGVVVGVTNFGVFVQMKALLAEGLVHVRDMGNDYWEYDERNYALVGSRTNKTLRLGDDVRVQIASASVETRKIDLLFVD